MPADLGGPAPPSGVTGGTYLRQHPLGAAEAGEISNGSRQIPLAHLGQDELDLWLTTGGPAAPDVRDFLAWAADHEHAHRLTVPTPGRRDGPSTSPDRHWTLLARPRTG